MSLSVPSRRLLRGTPARSASPTTALLPALQSLSLGPNSVSARPIHTTPSNQWFWNRKTKSTDESPIAQQMQGSQENRKALVNSLSSKIEGPAIFEDEIKETAASQQDADGQRPPGAFTRAGASLVREHLARAVDPDPRSRVRWERKMVIRQIQRGTNPYSREPRAEKIARTERQLTSKSPFLPTSTKKLVKLAHQIQGKTVAEALVQMRFSKKKMAQEVRYQLELARDLAIAERGMGLGSKGEEANGEVRECGDGKTIEIQTKDGKWVKIDDPTRMYVAEAWVNRGPWRGKVPDYRARGRVNIKHRPTAGISIVLKEEKTRIREYEERVAKKLRQGPWIHLPDRPITAQRQHYSW
ncbi:ribosomal protein L22/L17 [Achaetomium macrosporum]|uniref:Ribosomal protein L22/L17 n=1 Tax=Achaetomium macrosporum TaxID=79813 RepID=A0AAN7CFP9_9PEZI|nr:ribosomal protein L22/L17 [Achaetomium macrosporum]